jgi:hypothetical protein
MASYFRSVPLTTMSTRRLPHLETPLEIVIALRNPAFPELALALGNLLEVTIRILVAGGAGDAQG